MPVSLLVVLRATGVLLLLLLAPLTMLLRLLLPIRGAWTGNVTRIWHRGLLRSLGLRVQVQGQIEHGPALIVANHVSWLDVHVIGACYPCVFVAKSEVRDWPLVGHLARWQETLFLERGRGATPGFIALMAARMAAGQRVVLFPEGTTSPGTTLRVFYARLFQSAIDAGAPVVPVTINYGGPGADWRIPFINDDSLLDSLKRILCGRSLIAELVVSEAIEPVCSRDELANYSRNAVLRHLRAEQTEGELVADAVEPA